MTEVGGSNPSPWIQLVRKIKKHVGFSWGERLGRTECPYLHRWTLRLGAITFRVHHFLRSDDARHLHDHPWWFMTLVLRGGYTDVSDKGNDHLHVGSIRFRRALHRHTVRVDRGGVWTFVITGPATRPWGFWVGPKFRKANKYFHIFGHHPCDQP